MPHRVAIATLALAGCAVARESEESHPEQWKEEFKDVPVADNRDLDLLFVIDDSSSMADEQAKLAANLPVLVDVLETIEGGLPNVHIGVVSTDVADGGELLVGHPACQPRGAPFIVDVSDGLGRVRNYPGTLAEALACNAELGATGSDVEQPLESTRLALDDANLGNAGFLRDDAYLAVVIISDGDDRSPADPAAYASTLKSVKDDSDLVIVSLIAGPRDGCANSEPAPRLHDFVELFPNRNAYTTICNDDLSDGLALWFGWGHPIGNPCVEGDLVDVDPDTDGLQFECSVSDVLDPGTNDQEETVLPVCDSPLTRVPCWHLFEDPAACVDTPTHLSLVVERGGLGVPNGTHVQARCRTE
jgi:hypothetical protein